MQLYDFKSKRVSAWPWLLGLTALALIAWGVTSLLAAPQDELADVDEAALEEELPPTAIPQPPHPAGTSTVAARDVRQLIPLDIDDAGELVRAEGEVVATGTDGFWMLVDSDVLLVSSARMVRKGERVAVEGVLQETDGERTERIASEVLSRNSQARDWRVVQEVKLAVGPEE